MLMKKLCSAIVAIGLGMLTCQASFAQGSVASVCENPTFRQPQTSPFRLFPSSGVLGKPRALVAGHFFDRPSTQEPCDCDLAVALPTDSASASVAILRGSADGSFSQEAVLQLPSGETPQAVVKGRFKLTDSAGLDSIAVATSIAGVSGRVHLFVPDGTGHYTASPQSWAVGDTPLAMAVGDFNGDGSIDVAVANQHSNSLSILLGTGEAQFLNPLTVDLGTDIPNAIAVGRFSGPANHDDIAIATLSADPDDPAKPRTGLLVVRQNAPGEFKTTGPAQLFGGTSVGRQFIWLASANISAEQGPATERRSLALAYVDADAAGNAAAKLQVLLGKNGGGFELGQLHELGGVFPSSALVADLDDNGVDDLVVATRGSSPEDADGTILFFQGTQGADAGLHVNPQWFTIPNTFGIRPLSMTAGRFGPAIEGPNGKHAQVGLAVANAPDLNSISVLLGNGRGAFAQPTLVTARLPATATNFLTGDFHSELGDSYSDLAFIDRKSNTAPPSLEFLLSNGAGSFYIPDQPMALDIGVGPHIVLTGQFDAKPQTDIAVIDTHLDDVSGKPILRLFINRGAGEFSRSITPLGEGDRPVAMTAGHFSGQAADAPSDIAVADASGKITLLVNDKNGRFPLANWHTAKVPFQPVAIAASDNLNGDGLSDLVVKDANGGQFILMQNLGPGRPGESQFISGGFFADTGRAPALLVGVMPGSATVDELDDIVTYDASAIKSFKANNRGSFDPVQTSLLPNLSPASVQPPFAISDFGDGKPGLGAAVTNGQALGLFELKGDGRGSFTPSTLYMADQVDLGERLTATEKTDFERELPVFGERATRQPIATIAAPFRSLLHGIGKPDLALITKLSKVVVENGMCPNDPQDAPSDPPPAAIERCHMEPAASDEPCQLPGGVGGMSTHPGFGHQCPDHRVCETIHPEPPPPFKPFCTRTETYAPIISVFANTCND